MNWLSDRDMLPEALPKARIFTYDWDANCFADAPVQTLLGHADTLLGLIAEGRGSRTRPIIFVASCFGGLILAEVCPWIYTRWVAVNIPRRLIERPRKAAGTDIFCFPLSVFCFSPLHSTVAMLRSRLGGMWWLPALWESRLPISLYKTSSRSTNSFASAFRNLQRSQMPRQCGCP